MKFAVIGNRYQASKLQHLTRLLRLLHQFGAQVCVERELYDLLDEGHKKLLKTQKDEFVFDGREFSADIAVSLGGDGTFLKTAALVGNRNIPILGINAGRLGFLADTSPDDMEITLNEIYNNHYKIEERRALHVTTGDTRLNAYPYALNEVAVMKHDSSSMITIHTYINGELINTYQADGLIVATPTGSTGYSLSVGGPIIAPHSKTIAITPVASHSLNCRPFVICDDWEVTLEVESRSHNFLLAIDGQSESLPEHTRIRISRAPYTVKLVKRFDHTFFETLRNKMMWGADAR